MNYEKHYNLLIEKARNRKIFSYKELHHIIPKCFGGEDTKENIVELTAREHYIAHLLLYKMQTEKRKRFQMLRACIMFKGRDNCIKNSKLYEKVRIQSGIEQSLRFSGENHPLFGVKRWDGISEHVFYGAKHTEETKKKLSEIRKGRVSAKNIETGEFVTVSKDEFDSNKSLVGVTRGHKFDDERRLKCGDSSRGKIYITNDIIEKRIIPEDLELYEERGFYKGRLLIDCPHCGILTNRTNIHKYHFDKCKMNSSNN